MQFSLIHDFNCLRLNGILSSDVKNFKTFSIIKVIFTNIIYISHFNVYYKILRHFLFRINSRAYSRFIYSRIAKRDSGSIAITPRIRSVLPFSIMANETKLISAVALFAFDNATVRAEKRAAAKANAFVDGGSFHRRQMRGLVRIHALSSP